MENKIQKALTNLFDRYRIVFWYDSKKELREEYEVLELSGVKKLEIDNNEFALKYQILRDQPDDKFSNLRLSFQRLTNTCASEDNAPPPSVCCL